MTLLLALAATALVDVEPFERNANFMKSATGVTVEYTVTGPGMPGRAQVVFMRRLPTEQSYTCRWAGETFRFVTSKEGTLAIRDDWKQYMEGAPYPVLVPPPPSFSGIADYAYPSFLLPPSLQQFDPRAQRTVSGKETVRGASCDVVKVSSQNPMTPGDHTFWIDSEGKVLRWRLVLELQNGTVDTTAEFTKIERSAPSDAATYANTLPLGYVPSNLPRPRTRTLLVSSPAVLGSWLDARTNKRVDTKGQYSGKSVAIVFTAPECRVSATAEPFLVELRRRLKSKGVALIEVSLGPVKPALAKKDKDRQVFWDKDGAIERAYGMPGTPYFLVVDNKGVLARGWQGYSKGHEPQILENLLAGVG